jgi:hypothetical protein
VGRYWTSVIDEWKYEYHERKPKLMEGRKTELASRYVLVVNLVIGCELA